MEVAVNDMFADCIPVPLDSVAWLLRGDSHTFFDPDTGRCQHVQLGNVFEITAVGPGAAESKMELHEEVRADRHIKAFRHMSDFQPGRDASDPADVDLHD